MLAGAGLAFARAVGEFGSVVLISGNIPFKTEVASSWIFSLSQSDDLPAASAVSLVLVAHRAASCSSASAGPAGASTCRRRCEALALAPAAALRACSGYLGLLVILPVSTVFYRAFQHGLGAAWDAITRRTPSTPSCSRCSWRPSPCRSTRSSGSGVSLILARHRFPGAWLLDALVDIPLAISPVVIGLALILVYGQHRAGSGPGWPPTASR